MNAFNVNEEDLAGKSSLFKFGVEQLQRKNRKIGE